MTKQTIELTNLDKVFWPASPAKLGEPKEKYTKGDLIEYYKEVSPVLLPYLKDRPESMLRFPNGIKGPSFFQKNAEDLAGWIKKVQIESESEDKTIEYLLCQNEDSLLYMINLGCIDLNPWNSRIGHLDEPDYLVIDLDPEDTKFDQVVKTALVIRELLEQLEIEGFCKTSGASGLHIYIPMGARYTYEQTRKLAELLCRQVNNTIPDLTSVVRSPEDRQGKVYLDYLQNSRGQTLASVYSVRPQPGAPVSTPLKWSELTEKLRPDQFTIKNLLKRLDKEGDLFKGVLGRGISIEKVLKKLEK